MSDVASCSLCSEKEKSDHAQSAADTARWHKRWLTLRLFWSLLKPLIPRYLVWLGRDFTGCVVVR